LARVLIDQDDVAEDLVQDTWLVALRSHPDDDRPLGPWLGGVLRNLIYKRRRAEARRKHRERTAARQPVSLPTAEVLIDRAETQRLLVNLVMDLAEPYRSTLLLRYYEGLSAAEIARRQGIPAGTVRSRLKHGLDRLREHLDGRFDGDRRRWCVALAPLAGGPSSPAPGGPALVRAGRTLLSVHALLAATCALVVGVWLWRMPRDTGPPRPRAGATHRAVASGSARAIMPPQPWLARPGMAPAHVAGRVTIDGAPAPGADVILANVLTVSGAAPELHVRTDAQGRFDLGMQPAMQHVVIASAPGRTATMWQADLSDPIPVQPPDRLELALDPCLAPLFGTVQDASGGAIAHARVRRLVEAELPGASAEADDEGHYKLCLPPGESFVQVEAAGYGGIAGDIHTNSPLRRDFALVPEAIVSGRTVRAGDGAPVGGALIVLVPTTEGTSTTAVVLTTSDASGRFRLSGVAAGLHKLIAHGDGVCNTKEIQVAAAPGQLTHDLTVRLEPTARLRGRVLDHDVPVVGATLFFASRSSDVRGYTISQADGSFVIDRVPRGPIRLSVDGFELLSPKTLTVTKGSIDSLRIEVAARASVRGRTMQDRHPVPFTQVRVRGAGEIFAESGPDGEFELRGLMPGRHVVLAVSRTGEARGQIKGCLERAQRKNGADIELDRAATVAGQVVDAQGTPLPGLWVRLVPASGTEEPGYATTGPDGRFENHGLAGAGEYRAEVTRAAASAPPLRPARPFPRLRVADGSARLEGIRLVVQYEHLSIAGTVVDGSGAPQPDCRVVATRIGSGEEARFSGWDDLPAATTAVDGSFTLTDLQRGTYALQARSSSGAEATIPTVATGRRDVLVKLLPTAEVQGALTGFEEAPDVWVTRVGQVPISPIHVTATPNAFHVGGLAPGGYRISATSTAGGDVQAVELLPGALAKVALTNRGTARLAGRVVDLRSRAPVGGMICARGPSLGDELAWQPMPDIVDTEQDGQFDFGPGPSGELTVECLAGGGGYSGGRARVVLTPGRTTRVELPVVELREGATLDQPGLVENIGIAFDLATAKPRVLRAFSDGPAARAGLRPGDIITAVDGMAVAGLTAEGVAALIVNHAPDAAVTLTVLRGSEQKTIEIPTTEAVSHP